MEEITLSTNSRCEFIDITSQVEKIVKAGKVKEGICYVFAPHTTAGITINEHADPSVADDILMQLDKLAPYHSKYSHTEGNAPSHVKSSVVGCSEFIFIQNGRLVLGTWQGIFFCEFDGPRRRRVLVEVR